MAEPRTTRTAQAYDHLLAEILRGRWEAGETLSTYALADELRISRTPILEALKRLESDGLVEIIPQVGCRIVRPSAGAVEELFAVQAALEGPAAAAAARRRDDDALTELEILLRRMEHASSSGDAGAFAELDQRFHLRMVEAGGMARLTDTARAVWAQLRFQLARVKPTEDELRQVVPEHRELYEALERKAPGRAREAAERHARLSAARVVARLGPSRPDLLAHRALIYGDEGEFLATTVPFVRDGVQAGERVLAVTTAHNARALGRALGRDADQVEFRDSHDWYKLPSHTMLGYSRYLEEADTERVRVIGEVAWDGDARAPMSEWARYESIVNVVFALAPVTFVCPYDARELPPGIVDGARRTHPELCMSEGATPSAEFVETSGYLRELDRAPLDPPRTKPAELQIGSDLRAVREFIFDRARRAGLTGKAVQDTFLAVQEVAANVVAHGANRGTIRSWTENGELLYEVRDDTGSIGDPLVGQLPSDPAFTAEPRGLWLARLLCDLVEVRAGDRGLTVRLHVSI